jgi:hypothetical protein
MTIAKSPSERGKSNRRKGHTAERDLARWLRTVGFAGAERAVRTGFRTSDRESRDPGDITGTGPIVWSVKDCAVEQTAKWLDELDRMGDNATDVHLLVHKRRGHASPARWWCWMRAHQFADLIGEGESGFVFPVRMELGDAVMLLRADGHGDALNPEVAS